MWSELLEFSTLRHRAIHGTTQPLDQIINEEDIRRIKEIALKIYEIITLHQEKLKDYE